MPKHKPLNYPIRELKELWRDIRANIQELEYWDKVYTRNMGNPEINRNTLISLKKARRGVRSTLAEKIRKRKAVELAIGYLQKYNYAPRKIGYQPRRGFIKNS